MIQDMTFYRDKIQNDTGVDLPWISFPDLGRSRHDTHVAMVQSNQNRHISKNVFLEFLSILVRFDLGKMRYFCDIRLRFLERSC